MSCWEHHHAYPYSRRDKRNLGPRKVVIQSVKSQAHQRDHSRRPLMLKESTWPTCSEPFLRGGTLQDGPPPMRAELKAQLAFERAGAPPYRQGHKISTIVPTPEWLANVTAPVWAMDSRSDVNPEQAARAPGQAPLYRGLDELAIGKRDADVNSLTREAEGADPYVGFFLQRPLEEQRIRKELIPLARERAEREYAEFRARQLKEEMEELNQRIASVEGIKGRAPQSWASTPRRAAVEPQMPTDRKARARVVKTLSSRGYAAEIAGLVATAQGQQPGFHPERPNSTPAASGEAGALFGGSRRGSKA